MIKAGWRICKASPGFFEILNNNLLNVIPMFNEDLLAQLKQIFSVLTSTITLKVECDPGTAEGKEMIEFCDGVCSTSPRLIMAEEYATSVPQFTLLKDEEPAGVVFRGIPTGHEFSTLILAILNIDGKGKNLPDELMRRRIEALRGPIAIETYVSLTCTNCPDVAQALNVIAILNPGVTNRITDGAVIPDEMDRLGVQAVPTVMADDKLLSVGRTTLSDLVDKLEEMFGTIGEVSAAPVVRDFDMVIVGAGVAAAAAAIYTARKNRKVAVVGKEIGGNVNLTNEIDNLITTRQTTGKLLAAELRQNMTVYGAEIYEGRMITVVESRDGVFMASANSGEVFRAPQAIVATGSKPRKMGVPGEDEYVGKGVAFCPHCDGPMFAGKKVAVIGGGNAGVEAAIDLAAICSEVVLVEFLPEMKADGVLIDRMNTLPNVTALLNTQVLAVDGDGHKVTSIQVKDRTTGLVSVISLSGIFVQIGYLPNTDVFEGLLDLNGRKEIIVDKNGRTSLSGVYAAGDVTDCPYKQIVTSVGQGATAALTAFDDSLRK